jgi:hypothetical protein
VVDVVPPGVVGEVPPVPVGEVSPSFRALYSLFRPVAPELLLWFWHPERIRVPASKASAAGAYRVISIRYQTQGKVEQCPRPKG